MRAQQFLVEEGRFRQQLLLRGRQSRQEDGWCQQHAQLAQTLSRCVLGQVVVARQRVEQRLGEKTLKVLHEHISSQRLFPEEKEELQRRKHNTSQHSTAQQKIKDLGNGRQLVAHSLQQREVMSVRPHLELCTVRSSNGMDHMIRNRREREREHERCR